MKKGLLLLTVAALAITSLAADEKPMGAVNFALKGAYIAFTDSSLKDLKLDTGPIGGAELYLNLVEGLYIGAEGGYVHNKGNITVLDMPVEHKLTYVPVELNAKYVFALAPWLALDVGGGACYSYGKMEVTMDNQSETDSDWMPGGQGFADLNFIAGPLCVGVDGKYQLLAKFKDSDFNMNNWRVGAHLGLAF